jgi:nitrite reductase (NADH) large subunit
MERYGCDGGPAPVVIVGAGPVGVGCARALLGRRPDLPLVLYGGERWAPYDRVRLTPLLAGEARFDALSLEMPAAPRLETRLHCPVVALDRAGHTVTDATGRIQPYRRLILATGARPHRPAVPGIDRPGVFVFRDLDDAAALLARSARSRSAVVLGGGLLGLEAARGLARRAIQVTIIEHLPRLMPAHLDDEAAALLAHHVAGQGIAVVTGDGVRGIRGRDAVEKVLLASGRTVACDMLVVATGIRPDIALGRDAGLTAGRGLTVDDRLRTSDPDIFAIGDCAEHRGRVHGLIAPGLEQAAIAAHNVLEPDGAGASYRGAAAIARLDSVGLPLISIGQLGEDLPPDEVAGVAYRAAGPRYRKLILRRGRLIGAVGLGDWPEAGRIHAAVTGRLRLFPWHRRRFTRLGSPWPAAIGGVADWPADAPVCVCTGITVAAIRRAIAQGHDDCDRLVAATGAGIVCGSCRPLLAELAGSGAPGRTRWGLAAASGLAAAALLPVLGGPLPAATTSRGGFHWDQLWLGKIGTQATGYALLGLAGLGLALALPRRGRDGDREGWRLGHVLLGAALLAMLALHTGLDPGHGLNRMLATDVLALALAGAVTGGLIAAGHRLRPGPARRLRRTGYWLHIGLLWPLPLLIAFHILAVYYF